MFVLEVSTNKKLKAVIEPVVESEYRALTKKRFFFLWKDERGNTVYKLKVEKTENILGVKSIFFVDEEQRVEIKLLSVSAENRGKGKEIDRITGNLIAFACRLSIKRYGVAGAVSLMPKTVLRNYYIKKYGMEEGGRQLFLFGQPLFQMLKTYDDDKD